jgi:N-acetyl-anhydromuramyl-L-alanine amidase AmpD
MIGRKTTDHQFMKSFLAGAGRFLCRAALIGVNGFGLAPTVTAGFSIGDPVILNQATTVRDLPGGVVLGTQPKAALGILLDGPHLSQINNTGPFYNWFEVQFETPPDGWVLASALAPVSTGSDYPTAQWMPADGKNFTIADRIASDVLWIIIHTTESSTASTVQAFQSSTAQRSAHFVVSRDGSVIQMVQLKDIAFDSGNSAYDAFGVQIEHERYGTSEITDAEYQASADLVQWLTDNYNVTLAFPDVPSGIAPATPAGGSGIIGEIAVPDPNNPDLGGGSSHKTDPIHWDWAKYGALLGIATAPSPSAFQPVLLSRNGTNEILTLNWTGLGRLEISPFVMGPWNDTGTTNGTYLSPVTNLNQYFRLVWP